MRPTVPLLVLVMVTAFTGCIGSDADSIVARACGSDIPDRGSLKVLVTDGATEMEGFEVSIKEGTEVRSTAESDEKGCARFVVPLAGQYFVQARKAAGDGMCSWHGVSDTFRHDGQEAMELQVEVARSCV